MPMRRSGRTAAALLAAATLSLALTAPTQAAPTPSDGPTTIVFASCGKGTVKVNWSGTDPAVATLALLEGTTFTIVYSPPLSKQNLRTNSYSWKTPKTAGETTIARIILVADDGTALASTDLPCI